MYQFEERRAGPYRRKSYPERSCRRVSRHNGVLLISQVFASQPFSLAWSKR